MKGAVWAILGVSFAGSAAACVMVGASYPIAIWAVAFGVSFKLTHPEPAHSCPLLAIAAAAEDGDRNVVGETAGKSYKG